MRRIASIPAPRAAAVVALLLSGGAHAAFFAGFAGMPAAEDSGGSGAEIPLLGNDFADLAAGVAAPVAPVLPVAAVRAEPATVPATTPPVAAAAAPKLPAADAILPAPAAPSPPTTRPAARPETLRPAPAQSARVTATQAPKPEPPRPESARKATASGNADRNAARGVAQGQATGQAAAAAGKAGQGESTQASASTAARYGDAVVRRIRATPQPRSSGRGTAVVGFDIGPSGNLRAARILRGSGSGTLDAAALDHIRRSAPFPPPPGGKASFSFEFVGRG